MAAPSILVTGATGLQGGAVVDALLADGASVRALVRDPASESSRKLANRGVELVKGDFDDVASLQSAMKGMRGLFSMQNPPLPHDLDVELRTGRNLVDTALASGIDTFVHTSVARAGDQQSFVGWNEGRWFREYWNSKSGVNDMVRAAGFPHWVILKPALLMANYLPPRVRWMWPSLEKSGRIVTAVEMDTKLDMIDPADLGRFAAAAFANPDHFHGQEIDLAAEALTPVEIAEIISQATGKTVPVVHVTAEEAKAQGVPPGVVQSEEWDNVEGYKVDLDKAGSYGIKLTTFAVFARKHASEFSIGNR
jgi:uncharacterized protein YbjT (DUF2867 family)